MKKKQQGYSAFISYRHIEPDMTIAKNLHRMLENYGVPHSVRKMTATKKIRHVFRDQEELPLSRNLGDDIKNALDASDWLIVIASPDYLKSYWCKEELNHFIDSGKKDRILVVLAAGDPASSFPEEICFDEKDGEKIPIEPLAADVRSETAEEAIGKLKKEKLRILAPMLGVTYDELRRRDREKKLLTLLKIGSAALALVSAFAIYAVRESRIIDAQRRIAAENEVLLLTEKAIGLIQNNDRTEARQYALQAYQVSSTIDGAFADEALGALSAACYNGDFTRICLLKTDGLTIRNIQYSPDDSMIAGIAENDMIVCFDASNGQMKFAQPGADGMWDTLAFSRDCTRLIALNKANNRVCILSAETGEVLNLFQPDDSVPAFSVNYAAFTEDGKIWILDQESSSLLDPVSGECLNTYALAKHYWYTVPAVSPNTDHAILFTGDGSGQVELVSPTGEAGTMADTGMTNIKTACFSSDDKRLLLADYTGVIGLLDTENQTYLWKIQKSGEVPVCVSVSPDDLLALVVYGDHLEALRMENGDTVYSVTRSAQYDTGCIRYTIDGQYWFTDLYPTGLYKTANGECYAEINEILAADHSGTVLIMDDSGIPGMNNMIGQGSIDLVEEYTGQIFDVPSWNPLKRESVLNNPWADSGSGMNPLQPRMFVTPDGRFVVLINDGSYIKIWDLDQSDDVLYRCYQHTSGGNTMVNDVAFTADSHLLATAGANGCSTVFDLEKGQILRVLEPVRNQAQLGRVRFNRNGDLLMMLNTPLTEAWIYSVQDGTELYHLYTDGIAADFGFDTDTGNGVILRTDGSARIATVFRDPDTLLSYAALLDQPAATVD